MKENNYSIRYALKEKNSSYCSLISRSQNGVIMKFTLEEARKEARDFLKRHEHEMLDANEKVYIPYCKIYNGRTFIEKVVI